jgi:hypothetical protein
VIAIITLICGYWERKGIREDDRVEKTLGYFSGGSQRRSIGISLLEGIWLHKRKYHDILVPLVANQVVYLLLSTESRDAHNERNLVRLITVLKRIPDLKRKYRNCWADVCDAIGIRYAGVDGQKGIPITRASLSLWARSFGFDLEAMMEEASPMD